MSELVEQFDTLSLSLRLHPQRPEFYSHLTTFDLTKPQSSELFSRRYTYTAKYFTSSNAFQFKDSHSLQLPQCYSTFTHEIVILSTDKDSLVENYPLGNVKNTKYIFETISSYLDLIHYFPNHNVKTNDPIHFTLGQYLTSKGPIENFLI